MVLLRCLLPALWAREVCFFWFTHTLQVLPQIAPLQNYPLLAFLAALAKEKVMAHQVIKIIEQTNQL